MRLTQVRKLGSTSALRDHLAALGVDLPVDDEVDAGGPLSTTATITDGSAGDLTVPNRFAVLPMEGWDGTGDGRPSDLVRRRWGRFAASGCGLVWGEATAVRPDGRANPNQLVLDDRTAEELAGLRQVLGRGQVAVLQLTHSGRWSRPGGDPAPRTAYQHPLLDRRVGASAASVLSDDELDDLAGTYVDAAVLAHGAGFDLVDVKHCHGYLLHELLSAYDRPGRYGGDLAGRTRFLRTVVAGIRERAGGLGVAVRLSAFDLVPFVAGPDGVGVPEAEGEYHHAFPLAEAHALLDLLEELGVGLVGTTAGSPYYNPHVQRPAYFPPSDGYDPPEDPLVGVARQVAATAELARSHPRLTLVGAGWSYLQEWLPHVAQAVVAGGGVTLVGLGRAVLSYPELAADVLAGRPLRAAQVCRTFSDCTTAPRNGLISGCYPLDPFYKEHPQRVALAAAKKEARRRP